MKFDELFEQRSQMASKWKDNIRDLGYTRVSFVGKSEILCPTLDKLLSGNIDNKNKFERYLQKILKLLNMTAEDIINYHLVLANPVMVGDLQNTPADYELNDTVKRKYDLFRDIIDLCTKGMSQ